jgi:hypothetical protein
MGSAKVKDRTTNFGFIFSGDERVADVRTRLAAIVLVPIGLLRIASELYGGVEPAFDGPLTTLLTLSLMALLLIRHPEQLKERDLVHKRLLIASSVFCIPGTAQSPLARSAPDGRSLSEIAEPVTREDGLNKAVHDIFAAGLQRTDLQPRGLTRTKQAH